jgi:hypothetical protein
VASLRSVALFQAKQALFFAINIPDIRRNPDAWAEGGRLSVLQRLLDWSRPDHGIVDRIKLASLLGALVAPHERAPGGIRNR